MNTREAKKLLTRYALGDLDPLTRQEVKQQIEQSESCRAAMQDVEPTLDLVRVALAAPSNAPERLSEAHRQRIRAAAEEAKAAVAVAQARRPSRRAIDWIFVQHPLLAKAAAVLLIVFVIASIMAPAGFHPGCASRPLLKGRPLALTSSRLGEVDYAVTAESQAPAEAPPAAPAQMNLWRAEQEQKESGVAWADKRELPAKSTREAADRSYSARRRGDSVAPESKEKPAAAATPPPVAQPSSGLMGSTVQWEERLDDAKPGALKGAYAGRLQTARAAEKSAMPPSVPVKQAAAAELRRPEFVGTPVALPPPAPPETATERAKVTIVNGLTVDAGGGVGRLVAEDKRRGAVTEDYAPGGPGNKLRDVDGGWREAGGQVVRGLRTTQGGKESSEDMVKLEIEKKAESGKELAGDPGARRGDERNGRQEGSSESRKTGAGTLTLSGADTDGDGTVVNGGVLAASKPQPGNAATPAESRDDLSHKKAQEVSAAKYFFSQPAAGDRVAIVKSPATLDGIDASFSSGQRGSALPAHGGEASPEDREKVEGVKDGEREANERDQLAKGPDLPVREPRPKAWGVNPFVAAAQQPFSTFSIDVDTASYTLSRNELLKGRLPAAEAVRTEEFVNFFDYGYKAPARETFRVCLRGAPSAFGRGFSLLEIDIKGRRLGREEQRAAVLTFLVDTSGSMDKPERIGLVKEALRAIVGALAPWDRVAIVQFDSHARVVVEHTPVSEKPRILEAVNALQCSGSTDLEEGMNRAYALAASGFVPGGENRVLLLSDGVANLGNLEAAQLLGNVEKYRKQGILCSVFGFGSGTYDDTMLETLANKGDGNYAFIDSPAEVKRVLVDDLGATLNTIAKDVKIQVEFNPKRVKQYRQLGYENRQLRKEDFRNDAVDAGEVGSGQSVTALYELEPQGDAREPVGTVRVRYRRTDTGAVEEIEQPIRASDFAAQFAQADVHFRLAACVAEFSEILRVSPHAQGSRCADVAKALHPVALELNLDSRVQELLRLVQVADGMMKE